MCGICGEIALGGEGVAEEPVRAMLAAMAHRGPDGEGVFREPGLAAGARRLAVIDIAGGAQPIGNEDGTVQVVFNGEIYNFRELRDDLVSRGHRFRTRSDTETLVHLWEEHGTAMVHRLNGMFAFCIHDRRTSETFVARDRLGIKPLYWARLGPRIVFASELGVLLRHPEVPAEIDPASLVEQFCLQFVGGERTVYRGVQKLLPGHALHVRGSALDVQAWYRIPPPSPRGGRAAATWAEELRELLASSVAYRKIADVPLGTFLSGGIDSTIVTGVLAKQIERPVETFSVGFEGTSALDERAFARLAAEHHGTRHHELVVSPLDFARELPRLIEHLGQPLTDPALVPTYLLSRFARERVTVVLTGEGADELFAGYERYRLQQRLAWLGRVPGLAGAARGRVLGPRAAQAIAALAERDPARRHVLWSSAIGPETAGLLFEPALLDEVARRTAEQFAPYFDNAGTPLGQQLYADQHEWLAHDLLAKVDRASMAVSLEARVPFLDHRIVEWAAGLPDDRRIRGGVTKVVLREAFGSELPQAILHRPKRGFDLPLAEWTRGPLRTLVTELADALPAWPGLLPAAAADLVRRHLAGQADFGLPVFNLLSIALFLDRRAKRR